MALFTATTARIAAQASVAARKANRERPPAPPPPAPPPLPTTPADDFAVRKLARVRGQIERVELLLDDADDPQAVDRFANALTRLYDLERVLAGRPLPGSRRPREEGRERSGSRSIYDGVAPAAHVQPVQPAPAPLPEPELPSL